MKRILLVLALPFALLSCGRKEEKKLTPISYEMKTFRVESKIHCKTDSLCAFYQVSYPAFTGLDTTVLAILKKDIDSSVSMGNPEAEGKTMEQIGAGFIQDYEDFRKEMPEVPGSWNYKANVTVETLTDSLLSLSVQEEYYTGGAHGGYGIYYINLNPRTGEEFTLENLLKPGFEDPLTKIGEKIFRKVRELSDTASLNASYFEFPDDKFQLNRNFGFKKEGIVFYYNSYEIAAYASGPTEVLIPYEEIKDWLKH
ncbi:DUF3298 and DUF4163 domain-containing protein [Chryseolinea lacunae]|uniref:DUF3298 domain-containing protein n=1 Tax=Chryseolinea lacunae TaxID=2801331 RepID=A0ABS1KWD9_9BACT|nr:DUF3298 and DUF4163 domain-containing protein [Chryseolinea lacunae]MBL0743786.1 DUF3298 domain-containing protein [Chryseolinea lacunae]